MSICESSRLASWCDPYAEGRPGKSASCVKMDAGVDLGGGR